MAFFVIPMVCLTPEATRNDYFWMVYNWYMAWWCMYNKLFYLLCWYLSFCLPCVDEFCKRLIFSVVNLSVLISLQCYVLDWTDQFVDSIVFESKIIATKTTKDDKWNIEIQYFESQAAFWAYCEFFQRSARDHKDKRLYFETIEDRCLQSVI